MNGNVVPVTIIQAGPCHVTQVRNQDRDGYVAVQWGFGETKAQRLTKGQLGHLKRNNLPALRYLREFVSKWRCGRSARARKLRSMFLTKANEWMSLDVQGPRFCGRHQAPSFPWWT